MFAAIQTTTGILSETADNDTVRGHFSDEIHHSRGCDLLSNVHQHRPGVAQSGAITARRAVYRQVPASKEGAAHLLLSDFCN